MAKTPLQRAYEQFGNSQAKLAEALGTSQQNVSNWLRKGRPLPAEFVLDAERTTGIHRTEWRPDIYPAESAAA